MTKTLPKYLTEWNASCVDAELTRLNVTALEGDRAYEYLFHSEDLPRRNDGRIRASYLKRYQHIEQGGWWCSGIDLLTGDEDVWGCFKPSQPRISEDRCKAIKYEHPPKMTTGVFALRVTEEIWRKIARRYQVKLKSADIQEDRLDLGFWQWLQKHPQIPLCITEGAKKAGTLLSAGYAAIALPGVHNGYRVPKNEWGEIAGKTHLIPQLQVLATQKRPIYLVFDQDSKPNTIKAVNGAIRQMGYLLTQAGCTVNIVTWNPQWGKGIDDLIALQGTATFERLYQQAVTFDTWKAQSLSQLTYTPDIDLNCHYLPACQDKIPQNAQLIALKSPKGTGKTKFLEKVVQEAINQQKWVLVLGHRVQLVEELCQRFGLNYITAIRNGESNTTLGYGLCVDSLHPQSQAQFNAQDWSDGIVIIDEVEQVLWHALNSNTCRHHRVAILKSLKTLMQNTLGSSGKVYVADADLSDISLDYLLTLAGVHRQPFVIQNAWQPEPNEAWQVLTYSESSPKRLVQDLEQHIRDGGKPMVCLSAQKLSSQWGTRSLEAYLCKQFPQARILRIDSESVSEPNHPAYRCITRLNEILADYDIVLASPSLETGVSIELRGHFTSVWAIAQGVQSENAVRQSLGRLRDNIPRYLWVASYGFNKVGNGSTSIPGLLNSGQKLTQLNIRLLQQSDFAALDDLDTGFQAESLLGWARFAVRTNASMIQYRDSIWAALQGEGHQIIPVPPQKAPKAPKKGKNKKSLTEAIDAVRSQNYQAECNAIALAENLRDRDYQALRKRPVKTPQERHKERKYELFHRYDIPVTPELVVKDDNHWYRQIRLHYFLTLGRDHLSQRDADLAQTLLQQGQGSIFPPDFNRSQLGAIVGTLELLKIPDILAEESRELCNTDPDLRQLAQFALANRTAIRTTTGVGLAKNYSPVTVLRRFLELLGYSLKYCRIESQGKKRVRIYQIQDPADNRLQVFERWLVRDTGIIPEDTKITKARSLTPNSRQYYQLSFLDL
ncbi:MAG: plasmid replication protein, CyRepA1 family [Jaaginema sp. PMC 1079.18]|nr:plasmid replication protein, CyRepA1 family [Jaaginema sp. PMC 1080.18]MEC4852371.1 plasmid replication protein, CyRepA1 family [Jaaginema sp. PMC 1079.18]MEC4868673.1 plasmid replication protein, CyRepA1 family [Jaaginema sp. PMC 1078.18]